MHLFDVIPKGKLNTVDLTYPSFSATDGSIYTSQPSPLLAMLGERWQYSEKDARKLSDQTVGFCGSAIYQLVRTDPSFSVALGSWAAGRPVFWQSRANRVCTPNATAASHFAGIALNAITAKGNITLIAVAGEVDGLFDGTLTKGTPVENDNVVLKIASTLGTLDVLADATAVTWGTLATMLPVKVAATVTAGAKSRVLIARGNERVFMNSVH